MKSVLVTFAVLCAATAFGQVANTYGTASEIVEVIGPPDLDPIRSDQTYAYFLAGRYLTVAGALQSTLKLPAGSVVSRYEIDACDNSGTGEVSASLFKCISPFNSCSSLGDVATGIAFSDGGACGTYEKVLAAPETINNESNIYLVQAQNTGNFTSSTRIAAVRVYYKLQVSPAPGAATFNDVPINHPFFRFIEALAASGITGGCGGGNFCPDAPITRGQMAVFLSAALGLHWPN